MVVKLSLLVTVMVSLVTLGLCSNIRGNGVFIYAPKPAVLNKDFLMICETTKNINGIRWRKDGQNIAFLYTDTCSVVDDSKNYSYSCKEVQFNLTIPKSQLTDELHGSVWSCVNPYGGISNELSLYINIPIREVTFKSQRKILKLKEGDLGELECLAGPCRPPANISFQYEFESIATGWTINEQKRNENTDTYITTSMWKFQALRSQNGKLLTCKAVNGWNSGYSAQTIKMEIIYGPESARHSLQSSNLIIPEYESSEAVTCSSDCNPACNFTWWHRGTRVIDGSTLILTNVSKDQAGTYVCNASNVIGSGMTEIRIDVSYQPKITELEAKTNPVMENDRLDLLCKADSFPTSNVSWMRSNTTLSFAAMAYKHHIKHAKCWDTGTYTCKASNGHGEPVSKAIDIFVNCKPRLDHRIMTQQNIQTKYVRIGSYLMIKFHFIAYPAPQVSWRFYRNGSSSPLLLSKHNVDVRKQNNLFRHTYRLFILSIKDEDFGYYTVYVENQYGRSTAQVHVVKKTMLLKEYIIIGLSSGLGFCILAFVVVYCVCRRKSKRKDDILVQIQEFEMQQCEFVYQNQGRIMELLATESYDDLTEDDPIYNESKYGKIKEIKVKDNNEKCSSCERIQEFEMQQCEFVYQNQGRIMELLATESYDDLTEDDPIYNKSKYGKIKEIKVKDNTEDCSSCESYIESVSICKTDSDYSVEKLDTDQSKDGVTTGLEDHEERQKNENTNAPEYFEIIDIIKNEDDVAEEKRQSASSDEYDDTYVGKSSNAEGIKDAYE